ARPVVGDTAVQPGVPGLLHDYVRELLLGDRVADLHGGDRAFVVEYFRRECGAVDTVLAHPATHHHDEIAGVRRFLVQLPPPPDTGHHADRAGKDEGFSGIAGIEVTEALRGRDARAVPAHANTPDHAIEDLAGGEDRVRCVLPAVEGNGCIRVAHAKPINVDA